MGRLRPAGPKWHSWPERSKSELSESPGASFTAPDFGFELQNLNSSFRSTYLDFWLQFSEYGFQNLLIMIWTSGFGFLDCNSNFHVPRPLPDYAKNDQSDRTLRKRAATPSQGLLPSSHFDDAWTWKSRVIPATSRRTVCVHFRTKPKMTQLARATQKRCPEPSRASFPAPDFGIELQNLNFSVCFAYLDFRFPFSEYGFQIRISEFDYRDFEFWIRIFPASDFGIELQNLNFSVRFTYLDFRFPFSEYGFQLGISEFD